MSKSDFPLLTNKNIAYFDSAATTQKPKVVLDAIRNYYENTNANTHRSIYPLAQEATEALEASRKTIAEFIGAKPSEIVFTKNATEAFNLLAHVLPSEGVATTIYEHHSNYLPWKEVARVFDVVDDFSKLADCRTPVVTFSAMSNVTGIKANCKQIVTDVKAQRPAARVVIDACQLVAHERINVKDIGCDALVFSGHKLYGPTGIGVLYIEEKLISVLDPFLHGGGMVQNAADAVWNDGPQRFEAGTQDVAGIVGTAAAITYFVEHHDPVQEEEVKNALLSFLRAEEVNVIGHDNEDYGNIISFSVPSAFDFATLLGNEGVCVRSGNHCAQPLHNNIGVDHTVRISIGMYNDMKDVEKFKAAFTTVKNKIPIKTEG